MVTRLFDNGSGVQRAVIGGLILSLAALVGVTLLMASVPPVSRDALTHHLAIPKLFVQHGFLSEFPDIPFSYYPMNLDLLYFLPVAMGHDILAKYIHLFFGLMTAGLIYHYLRGRTNRLWALGGALLWLSTPIVVRLATEVYVDLGLAFFSLAALYSILRWAEPGGRRSALIWAGLWCGLALGTKYNALLILAILALLVPFIDIRIKSRQDRRAGGHEAQSMITTSPPDPNGDIRLANLKALMSAVLFAGVALTVFSPWMIRNALLKGNPLYPMMNQVFRPNDSSAQDDWSRTATMVQNTSNTLTVRRLVFKESPGYIALIPFRIFFEGQDDDPRYFDGQLNPLMLLFLPLALLFWHGGARRLAMERWVWFIFMILFMLMAFFLAPIRIRYLLPVLPAICILVVIGMYNLSMLIRTTHKPLLRRMGSIILASVMLLMFGLNFNYVVKRFQRLEPLVYLGGHISRDAYIAQRRSEYPLIQYANAHMGVEDRILALFLGQRRYYFDRDVIFNEGYLAKVIKEAHKPEQIRRRFDAAGITHLMVRRDLFERWAANAMSPREMNRLASFWNDHVEKLKDSGGVSLYALK